jgi:hypothetical protein
MVADDEAYRAGQADMTGEELAQWQVKAILRRTSRVACQHGGESRVQLPADGGPSALAD